MSRDWWRGAVIYQVYPRSFHDTNNDGIGDLPGIIEKLDYIASLGVDAIWVSPFFKSPMKDFGYDVSDYCDVDPIFGTLDDAQELIKQAHDRGIKIIIDMVLSHTSNEHEWFHDEDKKDWYVWADANEDGGPPNNWVSLFGGSAWEWDERYEQLYLHNFLKEQPDLNFHNPDVQDAMLNQCRFWLDQGVDGIRLDVVNFYFHDEELRDNPPRPDDMKAATQFEGDDPYNDFLHVYDKSQPENLEFLERLRALSDKYDAVLIGETGDDHPYEMAHDYGAGDERLHTMYSPHLCGGTNKSPKTDMIKEPLEHFLEHAPDSWPAWAFSNHDVVRAASRWLPGGNGFDHDPRCSKMLIALLGCLYGTIFLYQGEELGLPEAKLEFDQLQDPWGKELWPEWQGRDGCRTPIPWDEKPPQKSWLPMAESHLPLNAEAQEEDEQSVLNFTRRFLAWRKKTDTLISGSIEFIDTKDTTLLAFKRVMDDQEMVCVFNLGGDEKKFEKTYLEPFGFWAELQAPKTEEDAA